MLIFKVSSKKKTNLNIHSFITTGQNLCVDRGHKMQSSFNKAAKLSLGWDSFIH